MVLDYTLKEPYVFVWWAVDDFGNEVELPTAFTRHATGVWTDPASMAIIFVRSGEVH